MKRIDPYSQAGHRNNVGCRQNPNSMTAQGDFPVKITSQETRPDYLEVHDNTEGSIEAGTSFEQGLYELGGDTNAGCETRPF